jgi:hypothetical protein
MHACIVSLLRSAFAIFQHTERNRAEQQGMSDNDQFEDNFADLVEDALLFDPPYPWSQCSSLSALECDGLAFAFSPDTASAASSASPLSDGSDSVFAADFELAMLNCILADDEFASPSPSTTQPQQAEAACMASTVSDEESQWKNVTSTPRLTLVDADTVSQPAVAECMAKGKRNLKRLRAIAPHLESARRRHLLSESKSHRRHVVYPAKAAEFVTAFMSGRASAQDFRALAKCIRVEVNKQLKNAGLTPLSDE